MPVRTKDGLTQRKIISGSRPRRNTHSCTSSMITPQLVNIAPMPCGLKPRTVRPRVTSPSS
ncbi:hypothetical protein CH75_08990 [Dyella jiangningensis]|nr:hypothetical protein CH75_08990 [Dyella jiangningensis]